MAFSVMEVGEDVRAVKSAACHHQQQLLQARNRFPFFLIIPGYLLHQLGFI